MCGTEIFFGKTLANANFMCYKGVNFGKSPSPVAFFTKDSSVCPFKHLWRYQTKLVGREVLGAWLYAGKGRHWPPQKTPAAPGHESLDGRIRSREGGSDPSVVGVLMGAR